MLEWLRRLRAQWRLRRAVEIWYHPDYAPPALAETARTTSVDLARSALILSALQRDGLLSTARIRRPEPATVAELQRFHPLSYLESTNDPSTVARVFGLEPEFVDVGSLVLASLRATGGTLAAARSVVGRTGGVAFNLGGGFHHARADMGAGFCLHSDIAVAIANLRAEGFRGRVMIIDLDYHQGDGLIEAYAKDDSVRVYSIHGSVWSRVETAHYQVHLEGRVGDRKYLNVLRRTLAEALKPHKPDLVFYVAGNDVLAGDALGTFDLTMVGVMQRDQFVIDTVRLRDIPLVVTLGGGYSRHAWRASYNMIRYALTDDDRVRADRGASVRSRFSEVAATLEPSLLQLEEDTSFNITEADLGLALFSTSAADRLLDYYSRHGVEVALYRYRLTDAVKARGFTDIQLEMDTSDRSHQIIRVRGSRGQHQQVLLVELVMRRRWIPQPGRTERRVEVLSVEWMLLQDPTRHFSLARPPLPGQEHPGLGVSKQLQEVLVQAALRLQLYGLLNQPAYLHTAMGTPEFRFVDPQDEGHFRALVQVLKGPVDEVSRAVDDGHVRWSDGEVFKWRPGPRLLPVREEAVAWFSGPDYTAAVDRAKSDAIIRGFETVGPAAFDEAR
ncbi:MAG: histone deacetylase [Myxococcota bacterium]